MCWLNYNKIKNEMLDYVVNNYLYTLLIQEYEKKNKIETGILDWCI